MELPAQIRVLGDANITDLWERFEVFEALHHLMTIMNPMSDTDLNQVIAFLKPQDGDRMLDIACGHGELLLRAAAAAPIQGFGIDLSPWQISRAAGRAIPQGSIEWVLGNGADLGSDTWDIIGCLGASWIWDGFEGTARAVGQRLEPGGRAAIGDLQRHSAIDPASVPEEFGGPLSREEQMDVLTDLGLQVSQELVTTEQSWYHYQDRVAKSALAYYKAQPSPKTESFVREQEKWAGEPERAKDKVAWTVWLLES